MSIKNIEELCGAYKSCISKYREINKTLSDLIHTTIIESDGFKLTKSTKSVETFVFELNFWDVKTQGTITIKEIFLFMEEHNYSNESTLQAICELIFEKIKSKFINNMYEKK